MTRIEAAVKAWDHYWGDRYGDEALEEMGDEVKVALAAADAHDAAHGIHRLVIDDETVERAIGEVSHHVTPVIGWMILAASQGRDPDQYHDALTERIELAARAVLAAAVEARQ